MKSHVRAGSPTRALLRASLVAAGATAAFMLAGCSDATGTGNTARASVSFRAASNAGVRSVGSGDFAASVIPVTSGGHTIDVTSAELVVSKVTLKRVSDSTFSEGDSDSESDSDARDAAPIRLGATTVALPLDSGVITPFAGQVPVGTYDRLRLDTDFLRVKGTYDGQAFDVTLPVNLHLQLRLNPPLNVSNTTDSTNVTVKIAVPQWFIQNGTVVDPRQLQSNPQLLNSLRSSIRASFHAMRDRDKDGDESDSDSESDSH